MPYNGYGGYGTYPFPTYTNNFPQQYNGNQPTPYSSPQAPQAPFAPMSAQPQGNGSYAYINGIEGAKAFMVMPNQKVILFDSDSNHFFIKQANQQGQAVLKVFEYTELDENAPKKTVQAQPMEAYVTKQEFEEFKKTLLTPKKEVVNHVQPNANK